MSSLIVTSPTAESLYPKEIAKRGHEIIHTKGTRDLSIYDTMPVYEFDDILAIGGGEVIDVAKYLAFKFDCWLEVIPTITSTDAMYTNSTGYREDGTVKYLPTKAPDKITLVMEQLLQNPVHLNALGWADIFSAFIACYEWPEKSDWEPEIAYQMLHMIDECVRPDTENGILHLMTCLADEVAMCEAVGSANPEEGSEHQVAYKLEHRLLEVYSKKVPHGELVARGIIEMSDFYDLDTRKIQTYFDRVGLRPQAGYDDIVEEVVEEVVEEMK